MGLPRAIRELTLAWDRDVKARIPDSEQTRVARAMRELVDNKRDLALMNDIVALVANWLPMDHPVREALKIEDDRSVTAAESWAEVIERLGFIVASLPN